MAESDTPLVGPLPQAPGPASAPLLFLVVLGGRAARAHVELHDVRFVAGRTIEDTLPELRRQWFGRREGLHLDSLMAVRAVDGWAVTLGREPAAPRPERLWFVNLGAYRPECLLELHHIGLVVARSPQAAKGAARRRWLRDAQQTHKDDLLAVDDCLALEQLELLNGERWHVQLSPHPEGWDQPQVPDWFGYRPI
ncbi:MAG: DUF1543 domain-containing protein [Cyanobacteriota bacterium]|nr:DUF1543 domain-containing protein [Cyanobacteriota bacterium]